LFSPLTAVGRVVPSGMRRTWPRSGAAGLLVPMMGLDGSLALAAAAAAAVEQVRAAQRQVAGLVDDVEGVTARVRAAADIPWSGDAARAWRASLEATRQDLAGGVRELGELQEVLEVLLDHLRS